MSEFAWQGVFPALTTKFKGDFGLDFDAMAEHLEFQLEAGVDGVIILGSLGENATLDAAEKLDMVRFFKDRIDARVPLVACIAESGTREACELAAAGEMLGVDGYMLLPPMRYASDREETLRYFEDVADATGLPIMLYNNPLAYGTDVLPEDLEQLAENPAFVAVKESSGDPRRFADIRRLLGDRFALFCGVDDLALDCFMLGAVGWVAGLVVAFPHETVRLYELMRDGDWEEARQLYEWFLPLLHLDVGPRFVQQIKYVEELMGVGTARVRPPRQALDEPDCERIRALLETALDNLPKVPRR